MKPFCSSYKNMKTLIDISKGRKPCFDNLLKVLDKKSPSRPTLFEFFLNDSLYMDLTGRIDYYMPYDLCRFKRTIDAFRIIGYDYATIQGSDFHFSNRLCIDEASSSYSANRGSFIKDWEDFEKYVWPDPESYDYSRLEKLKDYLPDGMKIVVMDADGILETVTKLTGYDNLCIMSIEKTDLLKQIFDEIGTRMVQYHEICAGFETVGATIFGDDWAFGQQTMLRPEDLRKYVFPWHKKMVEKVHKTGKKAIIHSCGNLNEVFDDIIEDIGYDAKHSYEDKILPVEEAYKKYRDRIAILGGIDMDFLCRSTPQEVYKRAVSLLEMSFTSGSYALGSGNSIPEYVPRENYFSMVAAALVNQ